MLRKTLTAITLGAFLLTSVAPAALAEPNLIPGPRTGTYDLHKKSAKMTGGAYVRVPFTGGLKRHQVEEPRFGLAMAANFTGRQGNATSFASGKARRVLDLSLGLSSFSGQSSFRDTLQFNGMSFADSGMFYADEEEGEDGKKKGHPVRTGLMVVGGLALITIGVVALTWDGPFGDEPIFGEGFCCS